MICQLGFVFEFPSKLAYGLFRCFSVVSGCVSGASGARRTTACGPSTRALHSSSGELRRTTSKMVLCFAVLRIDGCEIFGCVFSWMAGRSSCIWGPVLDLLLGALARSSVLNFTSARWFVGCPLRSTLDTPWRNSAYFLR